MEHGVAGDAGVVDQNLDRSDVGLDLFHALGAGLERRNVPLEHGDAGFGLEFLRGFVVAVIDGGDLVAGCLERLADRGTDAAGAAGDQRYASHTLFLPKKFSFVTPCFMQGIHVLFTTLRRAWPGQARP